MIPALSLILLGFFLGMRHATDPDHVIAVSTIVTRQPTVRAALLIGSLWGVGHTLTIVAVGGALVLFTIVIPPRLGLSMEMAVALMLIVLGMWNLTGFFEQIRGIRSSGEGSAGPLHVHWYGHRDFVHCHPSGLEPGQHGHCEDQTRVSWADRRLGGLGVYQMLRPLIVGLVHGLAGSAAVALLVLALIKNAWWAMAYLVLFGIGTIAGMMLITAAIGSVLAYASRQSSQVERYLRVASGLLSVGFGLFLAYQIAVVDGLITGDPATTQLQ
jgi:ABC-type nickel/cobalt efflux system permease component RcnA